MNEGSTNKRRSARLSQEGNGKEEPPAKKSKVNASGTTTVNTKQQDGDATKAPGKRKKKVYDEEVEGFTFSKGKRPKGKEEKEPVVRHSLNDNAPSKPVPPAKPAEEPAAEPRVEESEAPKTGAKKTRRRLPTTPEQDAEKTTRRSKRISSEKMPEEAAGQAPQASPQRPSHTKSHANIDRGRSPSPSKALPVTVEKKRKHRASGVVEEKIMTIALPFADTPIIRRNKEMRKTSADGNRRSSTGMRGKRASSLIDEGRGHGESTTNRAGPGRTPIWPEASRLSASPSANAVYGERGGGVEVLSAVSGEEPASSPFHTQSHSENTLADDDILAIALPHAEVPTSELFKHISADLTEPRRMRCLLGWCGTRMLPSKPDPPKDNTPAVKSEFQALQAARIIQEELSQDLMTKGTLSDWFSRDDTAVPLVPLRKKVNPRNLANMAKAEELEAELERLTKEGAEWDELVQSGKSGDATMETDVADWKVAAELLDSRQQRILEQLQRTSGEGLTSAREIQQRLHRISEDIEFAVDQFGHGIHALTTTRETAERVAEKSLAEAAQALGEKEKQRAASSTPVDQMDALRGLARVLNARRG